MACVDCQECENKFAPYLDALPAEWRDQIVTVLCEIYKDRTVLDCQEVRNCETLTSLSPFTVEGTSLCITYKDENGVETKRCQDMLGVLTAATNTVDPKCVATPEEWANMNYTQRIAAIENFKCL